MVSPPSPQPLSGSRSPAVPPQSQSRTPRYRREASPSSDSSDSSQVTTLSVPKRSPYQQQQTNPPSNASTTTPQNRPPNLSRPQPPQQVRATTGSPIRTHSPALTGGGAPTNLGHRPRQHSQGFFEPSLPTAPLSSPAVHTMSTLTASQIAAQAAMHQVQSGQHARKRSLTIPEPINTAGAIAGRQKLSSPPPVQPPHPLSAGHAGLEYHNGTLGGRRLAATAAANVAFPRSALLSPASPQPERMSAPAPEKEVKGKEKSKMKLFHKPKSIGVSKDKDIDRKYPALPSPSRMLGSSALRSGFANASTTSLIDPTMSSAPSLYSTANASTSTLVPSDRTATQEKEKHKHHFLMRQKNKLKDSSDHHNLPLSSASSNSRPTDPNAPQPLYSFAPSSPGPSSTFSKSMSGLDLRHGGRALREKKREEKAAANALTPILSATNPASGFREREQSFAIHDRSEYLTPGSIDASSSTLGPPTGASGMFFFPSDTTINQPALTNLGASVGLSGMTSDDAWPFLKARLLNIFEGEDLRTPIEDFNFLVSVHIRRCIQKRAPVVLIEDLRELLQTGFSSMEMMLRGIPDERLVPHLVEMWLTVFGTILPFMQAVFLPLDLEFKGRGAIMSAREAAEFWGAMPDTSISSSAGTSIQPTLGEELDVRRITLITFRDTVVLPRNEALMAIFSRLSLESINAGPATSPDALGGAIDAATRPGTAGSLDPGVASFNSQGSTLLDTSSSSGPASSGSLGARSRATSNLSNTSAGSFLARSMHSPTPYNANTTTTTTSSSSAHNTTSNATANNANLVHSSDRTGPTRPQHAMTSSKVTETVGRMLQCVSVLASVQSGDDAQAKMERLTGALKYNWLGRGRTGRQRRGFVGTRAPRAGLGVGLGGAVGVGLGMVGA
ncbi:hypothetical protein LTR04_000468 [Oleoguttula sp. CCFEE 6159]|nr:hypothetical protein LTR04_000468 [Oleoguttula sp. CCFEE 6159]